LSIKEGNAVLDTGKILQVNIRSGNSTGSYYYVLGNNLEEIEAVWLAQEIQDRLNSR
jgi:hypothetical protein